MFFQLIGKQWFDWCPSSKTFLKYFKWVVLSWFCLELERRDQNLKKFLLSVDFLDASCWLGMSSEINSSVFRVSCCSRNLIRWLLPLYFRANSSQEFVTVTLRDLDILIHFNLSTEIQKRQISKHKNSSFGVRMVLRS